MPISDLSFGGFEAFVAGLAPRLVERGHEVTVYCRRDLYRERPRIHNGVRLRYVPSIEQKALGTPLHMTLCSVDAVLRRYDAILVLNSGNGFQCVFLRLLSSASLALNVDGVEWERGKWGRIARAYFKFASRVGASVVHTAIADSRAIREIYKRLFGIRTTFIPYGVSEYSSDDDNELTARGITKGTYGLIVGRMIPENNVDILLTGFQDGLPGARLLVVGGSNYRSPFHHRLEQLAGPNVQFLGHVSDQQFLWQLFRHSRVYLHGHSVGGTNPALLQALAAGCRIGALDVVFNREVLADAGEFFHRSPNSVAAVARKLWNVTSSDEQLIRDKAHERIAAGGYDWNSVVTAYERVLAGINLDTELGKSAK